MMKHHLLIAGFCVCFSAFLTAEDEPPENLLAKHRDGAAALADAQDEISADVQQLVIEQTVPEVIKLLGEVEEIMDEATDRLAEADTGGETIAAQTEIIEKIHAAAKERQNQGGGGKAGGAMMDMMERMMGKTPGSDAGGKGKGDKAGEQAGEGGGGSSDSANAAAGGQSGGKSGARRVPKAAGSAGLEIPEEFKKAFDAYNRGAERKIK
jgi:hypothetical protein